MLTIHQLSQLRRLKTKYGYDLAVEKINTHDDEELLSSLLVKELHDNISESIDDFDTNYPETSPMAKERILMAILGSITGHMISNHGTNKIEAKEALNSVLVEYQDKKLGDTDG